MSLRHGKTIFDFIPYRLSSKQKDFHESLHFLGRTYYEGIDVYSHSNKPEKFIGFKIKDAELYFQNDELVCITFVLLDQSNTLKDVENCLLSFVKNVFNSSISHLTSISSPILYADIGGYSIGFYSNLSKCINVHICLNDTRLYW